MAQKVIGFKSCKLGHILGMMRKNGSGVELLELYREAIDYGMDVPEQVDVIGVFPVGYRIRCSVCGGIVDWHDGRMELERRK
jgi:hypothetical protein